MHILIVEDDRNLAQVWAEALGRDGHSVSRCHDSDTCLGLLRFEHFDVIVLDLVLGEADMLGVADLIGLVHRGTDIVVVTGSDGFLHGELLRSSGAVRAEFRKPVPVSDLRAFIEHLGRRRGGASGGESGGAASDGGPAAR